MEQYQDHLDIELEKLIMIINIINNLSLDY